VEGINSNLIYLIHCKNLCKCKCHNNKGNKVLKKILKKNGRIQKSNIISADSSLETFVSTDTITCKGTFKCILESREGEMV
jgi:hypothetical protein